MEYTQETYPGGSYLAGVSWQETRGHQLSGASRCGRPTSA
ncbi:MAG: hypothetical protein QOD87_2201, partial [Pseudonocardiales bacterium]|nr:hypothetical protein [Pseudonocardiales bacterium]